MTDRPTERRSSGVGAVLLLCVVIGLAYLAIGLATEQTRFGVGGLLIMLAYGAVLVLGRRRTEAIALLAGDVTDERQQGIGQRALAFTATVLLVGVLGGFLISLATQSEHTQVFAGLCALGGVAFAAGIVWHSSRG